MVPSRTASGTVFGAEGEETMRPAFRRGASIALLAALFVGGSAAAAVDRHATGQNAAAAIGPNVDWPLLGNSYDNTRWSSLDQINASNVKQLGLAWSQQEGPN